MRPAFESDMGSGAVSNKFGIFEVGLVFLCSTEHADHEAVWVRTSYEIFGSREVPLAVRHDRRS